MITLIAKDGSLYYPKSIVDAWGEPSPIVLCVYDAGDCDTIAWPKPDLKNLRRALFDDRETGLFDDDEIVATPDGTPIDF